MQKKNSSLTKSQKFMVILSLLYEIIVGLIASEDRDAIQVFVILSIPCLLYWAGVWIFGFGYILNLFRFRKKKTSTTKKSAKKTGPSIWDGWTEVLPSCYLPLVCFFTVLLFVLALCLAETKIYSPITYFVAAVISFIFDDFLNIKKRTEQTIFFLLFVSIIMFIRSIFGV